MELRVLQYFLAIAREQSISGAAEFLHISQPTLSRQIKDMEEELGKQLFIRGNRKIELTEEGMLLRKRAEEIINLTKKTEKEIRNADSESLAIFISVLVKQLPLRSLPKLPHDSKNNTLPFIIIYQVMMQLIY